ncbi:FtsX-like permease family protein [Actinomycetaceae bacterium L2_0104]
MNELLRANVRSHARRYVATGLAVAISMAFVVIALAFSAGMNASLTKSVDEHYAGVAAVVTLNETVETGSEDALSNYSEPLSELDGVAGIGQESYNYWELRSDSARISGSVSPVNPTPFPQPELISGTLPQRGAELALTASQAEELGTQAGDTIRVRDQWSEGPAQDFTVTGIVAEPDSSLNGLSSGIYAAPAALDPSGVYSLFVALADPTPDVAAQEALVEQIEEEFGDSLSAQTGEAAIAENLGNMKMNQGALTAMMLVFPVIALAVAAIVVSTTFQIVLQQRRRELALLRTLGASAKQVRSLVLRETAIVGAVSSLVGVLIGVLLSAIGLVVMDIADSFGEAVAMQNPLHIAIVWLLGALITLAAGARPAMGVTRIPPIAALAPVDESGVSARSSHRKRLIAGIVIVLLTGAGLYLGIRTGDESGFLLAFLSGVVCLIGALLVVSVVLPRLAHGLGKPGRGVVAQMARTNTLRNPERTSSTGTAIVIGVTLIATMAVAASSMRETLLTEVDSKRPFDLVVTSNSGTIAPELLNLVEAVDGVDAVTEIHGSSAYTAQDGSLTLGIDTTSRDEGNPAVTVLGEPDLNAVSHSEVSVLSDEAIEMSEATPDYLGLDTSNGYLRVCSQASLCADLEIAWSDNLEAGTLMVSAGTLEKLEPQAELYQIPLRLTDTDDVTSVQNAITSLDDNLDVGGAAAERAMYTSMINAVLIVIVGLLAVSVLVALVGVTNTLSLSVIERTRENGLLRALGLTRRQMQRMLALEAVYVALTSALVGVVLGIFFGAAGTLALPVEVERTVIVIPWLQILGVIVIAILSAIVASWLPGRRAARTSPVVALATE